MFSNRIANSARFLQMPAESQLLYFHFILRADDDGIVESYPIMKMLGLAVDNYKLLLAKGYIRELNEDQVIIITDWLEHNSIRADRKVNSIYLPLLQSKYPELPIIAPKPRSDVKDNSQRLGGQSTDCLSKVKLSKVNISKDRERKNIILLQSNTDVTNCNDNINTNTNINKEQEIEIDKSTEEYKIAELFFNDLINFVNPSAYKNRKPIMKTWAKHIRLLHEQNSIEYSEMQPVWLWAMEDSFWRSNILSTEKFRKKFDTLKLQMKRNSNQPEKSSSSNMINGKKLQQELNRA